MKIIPSDFVVPRAFLSLDNYANLSAAHPWVDASQFKSFLLVAVLGANGSTTTTIRVQQAKNVLGSGFKDVTGKTYVHADPATGQRIIWFSVRSDELDVANGYYFIRLRVEVTGGTTVQWTGVTFGFEPLSGSAIDYKLSEVLN
jgi:hypothetical protein